MPADHNPQVSVKTEMTNSFKRLPSFRTPRDLKLSTFSELPANPLNEGRTKKLFVPNLNVTRKRQAEDGSGHSDTGAGSPGSSRGSFRGRGGMDRGRGDRGRGGLRGGKRTNNYIQGSGVFSEGLAPSMKTARWGGGGGTSSDYSTSIPKPRLRPLGTSKVDKEEEEQVMKELFRDDFIDDPENQADMENMPVQLPLLQCKLEDVKDESLIPKIKISEATKIKVKREHEALTNSHGGMAEKESAENPVDIEQMRPYSISELLNISQDKNYIFFQIPSSMPKLKMNLQASASNKESESERCVLRDLPAGRIGTLQILKSGKAHLKLGDVKLNVEPATQVGFKQELISVNLEGSTKKGNMINMGTLTTRMVMTPQWESLLSPES